MTPKNRFYSALKLAIKEKGWTVRHWAALARVPEGTLNTMSQRNYAPERETVLAWLSVLSLPPDQSGRLASIADEVRLLATRRTQASAESLAAEVDGLRKQHLEDAAQIARLAADLAKVVAIAKLLAAKLADLRPDDSDIHDATTALRAF